MNTFDYDKVYKKNLYKHNKEEKKRLAEYHRKGFTGYKSREFDWSIPWKPRLGIFKKQARSKVTFDPNKIEAYSYDHWCFVRVVKGKVVFNDYQYSHTTRRHQWDIKYLLRQLGIKIDVTVRGSRSLNDRLDGQLYPLYESIYKHEIAINRRGARTKRKLESQRAIKSLNKEIDTLLKLGATPISKLELDLLKDRLIKNEEYRIKIQKEKYAQWKLANRVPIEMNKFHKLVEGK